MPPPFKFGSAFRIAATAILVVLTLARSAHGQAPDRASRQPQAPVANTGGAVQPSPQTTAPRPRLLISDVRLRRAAESAFRSALTRVAANGCQGLLSEFVDHHGQPLSARLETLRMSLHDFLHTVLFVDGSRHRACQEPVAVTMPGSRVVYLCGGLIQESRNDAWVAIIHEALHSLGLAENPPTPAFISDRVRALCR